MKHIHHNSQIGTAVVVAMTTRGKQSLTGVRRPAVRVLSAAVMLAMATAAYATDTAGAVVTQGNANIYQSGPHTTITQTTPNVVINWQSFNIGQGQSVQFVQPASTSVALNRVLGAEPSVILGSLTANGRVFLLNPNGVLFGTGASVNVGGLVASTMKMTDADFMAGHYVFADAGAGSIVNRGTINTTDGGYVALLGRSVGNQGVVNARLGSVVLAGGEAVTLDVVGDGLLNVAVSKGAVSALVENGGLIQADGGRILLTAQSADGLLDSAVNNTGIVQARTLESREGSIRLMGDMQTGTLNIGGTMDATAPNGGNGGFIETSAARVIVRDGVQVATAAPSGRTGQWLIDPMDFVIGSAPGNNISGTTLSAQLVTTNININTSAPGTQPGDIFVNDAVSWTASGAPTTLSLTADRDANINAPITAVNGNLKVCCGRDANVNAAITTTRGSVLLAAGRDVNQRAAITVTDGNLIMCAANNVNIFSAITVTRGTLDPTRSLGLPLGLTLSADTDGTGPTPPGGTVVFDSLAPRAAVTATPVNIYYNPISYTQPTDYLNRFTLTEGAALREFMLVFAGGGDRFYDGTTRATLAGLKGNPLGVSLVAGPGAAASYTSAAPGTQRITFTGYTLAGSNAGAYALPVNCCGPVVASTTGTITPAPGIPLPPGTPVPGTPTDVPGTPVSPPPPVGTPVLGAPILGTPLLATSISAASRLPTTPTSPSTGSLLVVQEERPPTMTAVVPTPVAEKVVPPYVAPPHKPKPYRN